MTVIQIQNRGYNLMMAAFLFFVGLGFGTDAIPEGEFADKIDDLGLLVVGIIALVWYFASNRYKRTPIPIVLTVLALGFQVVGVVLEHDDPASFGDNIGGVLMLIPLTIFALWQYLRPLVRDKDAVADMQLSEATRSGVADSQRT